MQKNKTYLRKKKFTMVAVHGVEAGGMQNMEWAKDKAREIKQLLHHEGSC